MSNPYLLLWLEGPLQAWGHDSRFGRRDTLGFPTKSGILGLLCCALGAGGEQRELLAGLADLDMQLQVYVPIDAQGEAKSQPPLLRDFHMVGSAYDDADPWQSLLIPKTCEGKSQTNGSGAKTTYRYYLQDAAFAVALQVPSDQVQVLAEALQNPVWDLYLGRKNCVPTELIYQGIYPNISEAFIFAESIGKQKGRVSCLTVKQGEHDGEVMTIKDVPLQFGVHKRYRERLITLITPSDYAE